MIDVRPLTEDDRAWAVQVEAESWSTPVVARLGELVDPTQLPCGVRKVGSRGEVVFVEESAESVLTLDEGGLWVQHLQCAGDGIGWLQVE